MNIEMLQRCLSKGSWGKEDYRVLKPILQADAGEWQKQFSPLKKEEYMGNPIQVIDFFCGAGGTSLGFAAINSVVSAFDFLGGCDINRASAESYAYNFGTPLVNRDIIELAQDKEELDGFLDKIGYDKDKPTIIIGCAPCQGFTSHRKKHWLIRSQSRLFALAAEIQNSLHI